MTAVRPPEPPPWVGVLERLWHRLALALAVVGAGALASIFVLVLAAVVMRYGWGRPLSLTEELSGLLMTVAVFALLPITVLHELNIRVSLASERLPPRPKRLMFVFGQGLLLAFAAMFVQHAWAISAFTAQLKLMSEQSRLPLAPFLWLATASMALTGVIAVWRAWQPHVGDGEPEVLV
jgi:TRAP-type C4-dicarboxylate transport system permease small subunit